MQLSNLFAPIIFFCALAPLSASAGPGIVYKYTKPPKTDIVGVNAIVDLESAETEQGSSCDQRIADLTIDEVVYQGASELIIGFRAMKPANGSSEWYTLFSMTTKELYEKLSNAERRYPQQLVKKGAKVIVTYQVCGSGGFVSVRDIFAKSAINNP